MPTTTTNYPRIGLSWYQRGFLILLGIVFAIVVIEIAARQLHLLNPPPPSTYYDLTDVVGPLPKPYEYFVYKSQDNIVSNIMFNNHSLRDIDLDYAHPPNSQRIMFLGDSFTAGWQMSLEENYVSRMRYNLNVLNGRPVDYDLINAGFHRWGTDQEYLWYREEGYRYKSDLVVLQIYAGNDIRNNGVGIASLVDPTEATASERPHFLLDETGELVYQSYPGLPRPNESSESGFLGSVKQFLDQNVYTYRLARRFYWELLRRVGLDQPETETEPQTDKPDSPAIPIDLRIYSPESLTDAGWQSAVDITQLLLRALKREVESSGATFLVILIRPTVEFNPDFWKKQVETYNLPDDWDPTLATKYFEKILEQEHIDYLDTYFPLRAYSQATGKLLVFPNDNHWNVEGHCVVAVTVQNWLIEKNYIMPPANYTPLDPVSECNK